MYRLKHVFTENHCEFCGIPQPQYNISHPANELFEAVLEQDCPKRIYNMLTSCQVRFALKNGETLRGHEPSWFVAFVKFIRDELGWSLTESKQMADAVETHNPQTVSVKDTEAFITGLSNFPIDVLETLQPKLPATISDAAMKVYEALQAKPDLMVELRILLNQELK